MFYNAWVIDLETYSNCFTAVARELDSRNYVKFVIHDDSGRDELNEFKDWLKTRPYLIGFNTIDFDSQIIEFIWQSGKNLTAREIYDFKEDLMSKLDEDRFGAPYAEWDLSFRTLDLYKLNHFDNKRTSLKWLEFTTRWRKMADLPIAHHLPIPKSSISKLLTYNTNDVDVTYDFYYKCLPMIELRKELSSKYRERRVMNMSDSSIGSYIFEYILTKEYGISKTKLKQGSRYDEIALKDVILPYVHFESQEFKNIHEILKNRVYDDPHGKGIKGEEYQLTTLFSDMVFVFGSGGLHACYKAGEYTSDDDYVIKSVDVSSFYPNLAIQNKFYPLHIGSSFCRVYKHVYEERKKHPKGSALNYAYKIALNGVYGKSNEGFSIFYDPMYTLKITVNGQLLLSMLAEQLSALGRLLMVNTDGIEIRVPRAKLDEFNALCEQWELLTGLELEYTDYSKLVIKDVNNYIAIKTDGSAKRKGMFELYEDIIGEDGQAHFFNKAPNATIIPKALFEYYANDVSIYDTVMKENDIYEFLFGIKKDKRFEYWLIKSHPSGVIDIEKRDDRVLRYFISKEGSNIFKFWKDERKNNIQGVNRGDLISLAMTIRNSDIERIKKRKGETEQIIQFDVNKEYYIKEAEKVVDIIQSQTRDNAYIKYHKDLANALGQDKNG